MGKEVVILGVKKLTEFEWFDGEYRRAYDILAIDRRLPPAEEIYVVVEYQGSVPDSILGFSLIPQRVVWFRELPPPLLTFAHELIHIAVKKRPEIHEEVYAYNISPLVVMLTERGIMPKKNPLTLFEEVTSDMLLRTINEVYGYRFASMLEFFEFHGIMPLSAVYDEDEQLATIANISEVVAGAPYDPRMFEVLLRLLS